MTAVLARCGRRVAFDGKELQNITGRVNRREVEDATKFSLRCDNCVDVRASPAIGEQQVKLQSGAKLVGDVSMDGPRLVVDVDGAKISAVQRSGIRHFSQRRRVESAGANAAERAGESCISRRGEVRPRTIRRGVSTRARESADGVLVWCGPIDAGNGKAASEVFEPRREAIATAYPGAAERLASQIEARLALEKLPPALVERLDQIAKSAKQSNAIPSKTLAYAAFFRLVDQNNDPIASGFPAPM